MPTEPGARPLRGVVVVPLGDVPQDVLAALVPRLSRRVGVPCHAGEAVPADALPRLAHRPQLDADATLDLLDDVAASGRDTPVGVTTEDLGHPLFTFFFGRARMGGAALVSLHRLDPPYYGLPHDGEAVLARATLECLHELGHVAGLHHCPDYRCVMHFCGDVESLDLRGTHWCAACAESLPFPLRHALHG